MYSRRTYFHCRIGALLFFLSVSLSFAQDFRIPDTLRPRVNFWVNVFAKYGQHHRVIHHRMFPQVVFGVLDFTRDADELDLVSLDKKIQQDEKAVVEEVKSTLSYLASGNSPQNKLQRRVAFEMSKVPGGAAKYKEAIDNDWVRTQTGIREKFEDAIKRSGRYLHFIEDIFVREYNLPRELTRLPFIESTYNYEVVSSAGASGLWQFMPATAKGYGMRVSPAVDERKDPIIASRAAAQYLKHAHDVLGSWPLAITSYNHGIGGVYKKMKEAGTNDLAKVIENPANTFGFASSNFYPEFLAMLEVTSNYRRYFPGLQLDSPLRLSERKLPISMSIHAISKQTGVELESLQVANYALGKSVWEGKAPVPAGYTLRVPVEQADGLARANFAPELVQRRHAPVAVASSVYGGSVYTVRKGDTLLSIAKKYGESVDSIVSLNHLKSKTVKAGEVLTVTASRGAPAPKVRESKQEKKVVSKRASSKAKKRVKK